MVEEAIIEKIKQYLRSLPSSGIHASYSILFGFFSLGKADKWSDIDLVVIAP